MPTYFVVRRVRGPAWNPTAPMRDQPLWAEHAAFMNALAAQGFVVLGGPLGRGEEVLLVIDAASEDIIRARLAGDPWTDARLLVIKSVQPWTVLLDGRSGPQDPNHEN
jgi:uncharacterized protein YciI